MGVAGIHIVQPVGVEKPPADHVQHHVRPEIHKIFIPEHQRVQKKKPHEKSQLQKLKQSQKTLLEIAREVRKHLKKVGIKIQFEVNKEARKIVVIVKDPETDEVVRKIPPDFYLKMVEYLNKMQEQHQLHGVEIDVKY